MLNVVAFHSLAEEHLAQIVAVSSDIRLSVGVPADRVAEIRAKSGAFPVDDIESLLPQADVLFTFRLVDDLLRKAPRLKWIQFASAGVDKAMEAGLLQSDLILTTSSGIHAVPIGEYVLGSMLMFAHHFHQAARQQAGHQWAHYASSELRDKTLGIVGYGHIGREVARLALCFGMQVIAMTSQAPGSGAREEGQAQAVTLLAPARLRDLLAQSDYVLVSVPLVTSTHRLIGESELRAMRPSAFLVNISRGRVIDEAALVRVLQEKRIAGAGLDVFETEPLPGDSPLWDMENVILTPHSAGSHQRYNERATALFCDNLRRYLAGEPLINQVDKLRGY
jgi:phosphoglycerate dehydrogenase-like enzyme